VGWGGEWMPPLSSSVGPDAVMLRAARSCQCPNLYHP